MTDDTPQQPELFPDAAKQTRPAAPAAAPDGAHRPPNLGEPVRVKVPDFNDRNRPKTCLEVDFPILPINELSRLEGNAGKPIYQMSKWWARRRSCVFRALLLAAAIEAPRRRLPDGSWEVSADEAQKAVWDVYYANHQRAGNFKHLKVLDCFMGGGTTLVEGSRLGFQVAGVDLNPVAWFIVKNELACPDPAAVQALFDRIEAEVKPQLQPFYVTDCPRGHKGTWFDTRSGKKAEIDPITLSPDQRCHYRYEGPEVIYTFWAKHGPCLRQHQHGGSHRTPVFRTPVIAEKKLGVKYLALTCKNCKTAFHAELGSARMAPGAERVVLPGEAPFTELSQPFAALLADYDKGRQEERKVRIDKLATLVDAEPGLKCPRCGAFAGEWVKDILALHLQPGRRWSEIKKKDFNVQPPRNSTKPVYSYLLIHPDWLKGSPGEANGKEMGGYADASPDADAAWYAERLKGLNLIEVRGRIKLADDTSWVEGEEPEEAPETGEEIAEAGEQEEVGSEAEERKKYGLPRYIALAGGVRIDTRKGTVPEKSAFACGLCGRTSDLLTAIKETSNIAPTMIYVIQGDCPQCMKNDPSQGGRFFKAVDSEDCRRLQKAGAEWNARKEADLSDYWPRAELPFSFMTHQNNGGLPNWGYTHFYKMFNPRQLLVHANLLRGIHLFLDKDSQRDGALQILGAFQQYLRSQCMFAFWHLTRNHYAPHFSSANYAPKQNTVEVGLWGGGYGSWKSVSSSVLQGVHWATVPWEPYKVASTASNRLDCGDPVVKGGSILCCSATELPARWAREFDVIITDPPFGNNVFYGDLANYFYVWLRLVLRDSFPEIFNAPFSPRDQECIADRSRYPDESMADPLPHSLSAAEAFYEDCLAQCWVEANRALKPGGLMAFTFHHSKDAPWESVLRSLFEAAWILEATFPVRADETKGEGGKPGTIGSQNIEYDIIHVCRKRLTEPTPVSWAKMRQWVKAELERLKPLLNSYKERELSDADVRVILRGKALEFYSRHYGQVFTAEEKPLSIRDALLGINQLLDEDASNPGERPSTLVEPVGYQFLRIFRGKKSLPKDDVSKLLRGTSISQSELERCGWVREVSRTVHCVPIRERFALARNRPRREMRTEIDQAHFLIGAALPGDLVNIEQELNRDSWAVRRSVEAVLEWYARTAPEAEVRQAAEQAAALLRRHIEQRRAQRGLRQGELFDDLDDEI